jgi:hypothetical protein
VKITWVNMSNKNNKTMLNCLEILPFFAIIIKVQVLAKGIVD